jgi:hypothetical protein
MNDMDDSSEEERESEAQVRSRLEWRSKRQHEDRRSKGKAISHGEPSKKRLRVASVSEDSSDDDRNMMCKESLNDIEQDWR